MATDGTHTLRCPDDVWRRFRTAAFEDEMSLAAELSALLDLRDRADGE